MIRYGNLNHMLPVLETLLSNTKNRKPASHSESSLTTTMKSMIGKAAL